MATETAGRPSTHAAPERVEPGPAARARMPDADYVDAFRVGSSSAAPARAWAEATFDGGPAIADAVLRTLAWRGLLGMRLGPTRSPRHVAGWTVVVDEQDELVMHVDSWMLTARLVTETAADGATITTLLRFDRPVAGIVWAGAGRIHRALMPGALLGAARAVARADRPTDAPAPS